MSDTFWITDSDWAALFSAREDVGKQLLALLPDAYSREIGSTAVEGVIGKGDLDFLVTVPREDFSRARATLDAAFACNPAQLSNQEYQGYRVSTNPDVAVQLTIAGCQYDNFETFLDCLRSIPELLYAYNQLKREWNGKPMADYRFQKSQFIEAALQKS